MKREFDNVFLNKTVLVTGHTGFKGSWLCAWLNELGCKIIGVSDCLPSSPCHFEELNLSIKDYREDIRDQCALRRIFEDEKPDFVFHLAAQPLVRRSYNNPMSTITTNVIGTANVLDCIRLSSSVAAGLIITTDKVYENVEGRVRYSESDSLGGDDVYSASKASCEILTTSFINSFLLHQNQHIATVRAGNILGGGDWAEDRLMPDIVGQLFNSGALTVRSPDATRPWQHVLDCLHGYLLLGEQLLKENGRYCRGWNFGPSKEENISVRDILNYVKKLYPSFTWHEQIEMDGKEKAILQLLSLQSERELGWQTMWNIEDTIEKTLSWYGEFYANKKCITFEQLNSFRKIAGYL